MLEVEGINTYIGLSHILHDVSLLVERGEIVCLIGRNGVGKSTTLKSIMGITPPRKGKISFEGKDILGYATHEIAREGISYIPEDRRIFPMLTVEQNLLLGTRNGRHMTGEKKKINLSRVYSYFPALNNKKKQLGGFLSGGEQQMLTIARGLMGSPKLMLLDEPCEGLAPIIVKGLVEIIKVLSKQENLTILLVEQNARVALNLADRGYVLEKGVVTFSGACERMKDSEEVKSCCSI
ncbi:MAG: ABC transporter ATP-binding protein [Desulfatirhabdiaceae bacterium]